MATMHVVVVGDGVCMYVSLSVLLFLRFPPFYLCLCFCCEQNVSETAGQAAAVQA
jgi:hypothetical protein